MSKTHTVAEGEYLSMIARRYGHWAETVWEAGDNDELRKIRKTPKILYPGDVIHIPDVEERIMTGATRRRHSFQLVDRLERIRLRLIDEFGEALSDVEWRVTVDGYEEASGKTAADGIVEAWFPYGAGRAVLECLKGRLELQIGGLDPVGRVRGVQQRLNNLGFDAGPSDGVIGPRTRRALLRFQMRHGLKATGAADGATRRKLEEVHDGKAWAVPVEEADEPKPMDTSAEAESKPDSGRLERARRWTLPDAEEN